MEVLCLLAIVVALGLVAHALYGIRNDVFQAREEIRKAIEGLYGCILATADAIPDSSSDTTVADANQK